MFRLGRQQAAVSETGTSVGSQLELKRVGRSRMDDVVYSTRQVPWTLTLLQLLWTAGPVTWLAIQGGSLLGYGEIVTTPTYLFFAFYIVIAAFIGVLARSAALGIRKAKAERARRTMTRTMDVLPVLMFTARDMQLAAMPINQRRHHAASVLLRKTDLGPEGVALAVEELTGSQQLGASARHIDIYRRLGMYSRMEDHIQQSAEHREAVVAELYQESAEMAELLQQRLQGQTPSQSAGIPRHDNFIDHILTAAQHSNADLVALQDAEELITLTYELMCGREITRLTLDFAGDFKVARALDEVEHQRNEYRLIQASVTHHLRILMAQLADGEALPSAPEMAYFAPDVKALEQQALAALSFLADQAMKPHRERPNLPRVKALKSGLVSARRTYSAIERLHDRHRKYVRAVERWNALTANRKQIPAAKSQGIRIRESTVALTDTQKVELAAAFCEGLDELGIGHQESGNGLVRKHSKLAPHDVRQLAVLLILQLDSIIKIGDASVQRAIESSNAAYFEGLESQFSADAKLGLGTAVVKEVRQRLDKVAEVLVLRITRLYGLPVNEDNIDFLVTHYGADRTRLNFIATQAHHPDTDSAAPLPPPPETGQNASAWRRALNKAERALTWAQR